MRLFFYIFLLVVAICYTYIAFADLSFLTNRGGMGPGFFPRILGVAILASLAVAIYLDTKNGKFLYIPLSNEYKDVGILSLFSLVFVVMLMFLGYLIAVPIYIGSTLFYFNRGGYVINSLIVLGLPTSIYFLFGEILNASLPLGVIW